MAHGAIDLEEYLRAMEALEPLSHETMVPNILACIGTCVVFSVLILVLRILSRLYSSLKFASHDYLVFVGWVSLAHDGS